MTETSRGVLYALAAYFAWGIGPILWKELAHFDGTVILAHRILWASALLVLLMAFRRRTAELRLLLDPRQLPLLVTTALLLVINWFTYIYAVNSDNILQASLGYFINPLANILLGLLFLRERLRSVQWVAVLLAGAAIAILVQAGEGVPWLALLLAVSFAFYGLLRKIARADALLGTTVESSLMVVPALAYVALFAPAPGPSASPLPDALLLVLGGVQTALPLLWFSNAARRLPLVTLGFFQYIAPTCQFLLAVLVYGEPFGGIQLLAFALIWSGLLTLTLEARWSATSRQRARRPA